MKSLRQQFSWQAFKSSLIIRGSLLIALGTIISQGAAALAIPLISRLYDPESVGRFSLFLSISSVFSVVAAWRYELAIPLPAEEKLAIQLFDGAVLIVIGMTVLAFFVFGLSTTQIAVFFKDDRLRIVLVWIPLSLLAVGLYNTLSYWAIRHKQFRNIALAQASSTATPVAQVLLGFTSFGVLGLIWGQLLGQIVAMLILAWQTWRSDRVVLWKRVYVSEVRLVLNRYNQFPKYNLPHAFINTVSQGMPVFLLASFFGLDVVGFYGVATRILVAPINLVGQSFQQVFLQRISEAKHQGFGLRQLLQNTTFSIIALGFLPSLLIIVFGRSLFEVILGIRWGVVGIYSQWLTLWTFSSLVLVPANMVLIALERLRFGLVWDILQTVVRIISLLIGGYFRSPELAIALFSLTGLIFNLILIVYSWTLTK